MICVRNLAFSYNNRNLFAEVNLDFNEGGMYCLVGPNGCGKSTFVDCLLNVNGGYEGVITIGGQDVRRIKAQQLAQKIAYVPQVHEKSFPYTVSQVVLMGRTAYNGMTGPGKEDIKIVERALEETGLLAMKDRPYTQISGGEMQLVMLARALVQDTPVIIMDEPTAHLDFRNELIFLEAVADLIKRRGVTCILVTHSPDQSFYFEERLDNVQIVAFRKGGIFIEGSPSKTMDREFIGEVFGVEAMPAVFEWEGRVFRRIVPLRTI